jgi:hypothetical protein
MVRVGRSWAVGLRLAIRAGDGRVGKMREGKGGGHARRCMTPYSTPISRSSDPGSMASMWRWRSAMSSRSCWSSFSSCESALVLLLLASEETGLACQVISVESPSPVVLPDSNGQYLARVDPDRLLPSDQCVCSSPARCGVETTDEKMGCAYSFGVHQHEERKRVLVPALFYVVWVRPPIMVGGEGDHE